jgi:hypothetical protein
MVEASGRFAVTIPMRKNNAKIIKIPVFLFIQTTSERIIAIYHIKTFLLTNNSNSQFKLKIKEIKIILTQRDNHSECAWTREEYSG